MTDRMAAVDHTHPTQDAVAGAYRRGRQADGLRADGAGDDSDAETDPETARMRDVSHTPTDGDGANDVWARGETDEVRDDDE
ncbi:hypothetical protein [Haloplanus aerogenes]|uniref:Uncharacterized protein n=1 Tax=Haloplanus aerogenes TaxID=660522 RepID=A0A3M0DTY8_9EURY|nr:hypothetical protein [Haloplanus aerogenes]AZH25850.1 hypothetical protein DU502_10885 [Haloplanus aerogenes]RMB25598.1 hypothetical protein ATH50_0695 [Haloplanus aerogenes]